MFALFCSSIGNYSVISYWPPALRLAAGYAQMCAKRTFVLPQYVLCRGLENDPGRILFQPENRA